MADRTKLGLLATAFALAVLPANAGAAPYVPPGNSAANQYTEAVPTAGGPKATGKGKQGDRSPAKVLGARNAAKLDAQGSQGRAAAALAAATAPAAIAAAGEGATPQGAGGSEAVGSPGAHGTKTGNDSGGGEGAKAPIEGNPNGSSGLGEVIGSATGASSGQLGLLLPLLILVVVIWSVAYLLRERRGRPAA